MWIVELLTAGGSGEPTPWLLMVSGFAMIGYAARRDRRMRAAAG